MASISGNNTIVLKAGYTEGGAEHEEGIASGAILPGTNVNMTSAAESQGRNTYAVGATAVGGTSAGAAASGIKIAKEDGLNGGTISTAYASGSTFLFHVCKKGDVLQVLALSGEDIDVGEGVSFNAAGKAIAATVNKVAESLDDTGGALGADAHIRVRIL